MRTTVIIPSYNEEKTIREIIITVKKFLQENDEIIVVDDGSTDNTQNILKHDLKNIYSKLIINKRNYGKGYSIRRGITSASCEIIIIQDADLEYHPNDFKKLLKPIKEGLADVVYGSRFVGSQEKRVLYFWHTLGNKFLTFISNIFSNLNLTDMEVGYKAFKSIRWAIKHDLLDSEDIFRSFIANHVRKPLWCESTQSVLLNGALESLSIIDPTTYKLLDKKRKEL